MFAELFSDLLNVTFIFVVIVIVAPCEFVSIAQCIAWLSQQSGELSTSCSPAPPGSISNRPSCKDCAADPRSHDMFEHYSTWFIMADGEFRWRPGLGEIWNWESRAWAVLSAFRAHYGVGVADFWADDWGFDPRGARLWDRDVLPRG